jgi:transcriptional regulatory protein GAL4
VLALPVRRRLVNFGDRNMDDLHDRCQRLESLLHSIDPSIDIEDLLGGNLTDISRLNNRGGGHHDRKLSSGAESSGITTPDEVEENESENDEDLNPCKFEWHEGRDSAQGGMSGPFALADGMASLNIDSRDVGYLGALFWAQRGIQ